MTPGLFIVFEGLDGSGTSTQGDLLAESLRASGRVVHRTAEPSGGPVGKLLRSALRGEWTQPPTPETVAALFAADRLDHVAREITPRVDAGEVVVCDRYVASSMAYQAAECDPAWVRELNRLARVPDLTIFLDVPVHLALDRIQRRGKRRERFETEAMLTTVRQRYLAILSDPPPALDCLVRVDGTRDRASVAFEVLGAVVQIPRAPHASHTTGARSHPS